MSELRDEDLRVELYDPRPRTGMRVGVEYGVRVTHLPTGLVAECSSQRYQLANKQRCLEMLQEQLREREK